MKLRCFPQSCTTLIDQFHFDTIFFISITPKFHLTTQLTAPTYPPDQISRPTANFTSTTQPPFFNPSLLKIIFFTLKTRFLILIFLLLYLFHRSMKSLYSYPHIMIIIQYPINFTFSKFHFLRINEFLQRYVITCHVWLYDIRTVLTELD